MLGSDPIYEYDYQTVHYENIMGKTPTLEPIGLGGIARWCDWFFDEVFDGTGLAFQYTQAGQENSFGWSKMREGLLYQHSLIRRLAEQGKAEVLTLAESGSWYQGQFEVTPASVYKAKNDFTKAGYSSVWYSSRYYRANVMWDNGVVRFRDIYLFDEKYEDKYLRNRCAAHSCEYRNLPVMDGALYTNPDSSEPAGIYFTDGKNKIIWDQFTYSEHVETVALLTRKAQ